MNPRPTIEEQLRGYADAIDPGTADAVASRPASDHRRVSLRSTWLAAAAAVLVLFAGAALVPRNNAQQVQTVPVLQEPQQPSGPDAPEPVRPVIFDAGGEQIYWPGGSTNPVETVELFLDLYVPEWRDLDLVIAATVPPVAQDPTAGDTIVIEVRRLEGPLFAAVPMRFADGRWFLDEITSPLVRLDLSRHLLPTEQVTGEAVAGIAGELTIDVVYSPDRPNQRVVETDSSIVIAPDQVGAAIAITLATGHREVHARLVSTSGELVAFVAFTAPTIVPPEMAAGGPLMLADGVPITGDWRTREESLTVMMAEFELLRECSTAMSYTMPTEREWVELHGSWRPHGILGIGATGAAQLIGYRDAGWGGAGSPTQSAAFQAMPASQREVFGEQIADCWLDVGRRLGDHRNRAVEFDRLLQLGSDETQGERYRSEPLLAQAIESWQRCVRDATGVGADTPNTLARQFVFEGGAASEREREIAVADVGCQRAANLEESFAIARTARLRDELGDDVEVFDDYVRFRIETVSLATQVLDERGIVLPDLDADPDSVETAGATSGAASEASASELRLLPDPKRWVVIEDWSAREGAAPSDGELDRLQLDVAPLDADGVPQLSRRISVTYTRGDFEELERLWGDASSLGEPVEFAVGDGLARTVHSDEFGFSIAVVWVDGVFVYMQNQNRDPDYDITEIARSLVEVDEATWVAERAAAPDRRLAAVEAAIENVGPLAAPADPLPHWVLPEPWQLKWVTDMTIWTPEQHAQRVALSEANRPPTAAAPPADSRVWHYGFAETAAGAERQFVPQLTVSLSVLSEITDPQHASNYDTISALGLDGVISPLDSSGTIVELGTDEVRVWVQARRLSEATVREFLEGAEFAIDDPLDGLVVNDTRFEPIELGEWDINPPSWHAAWTQPDGPDATVSVWRLTVPELRAWLINFGDGLAIPADVWETVADRGVVRLGGGSTYDVATGLLMTVNGVDEALLMPIELDDWITLVEPVNADPLNPR